MKYLLLLLLFVLSASGAVVDYRALRQDQFTTNLPSQGYVGIKGYGVTNVPGTNIDISAGGSIVFTTNGANISISTTGLGQATNVFLIAGTNITIITNGLGTWTIHSTGGIATNHGTGFGNVFTNGWINVPDGTSEETLVGGPEVFISIDEDVNFMRFTGASIFSDTILGNGTLLTNLNGTNIDIKYDGGLIAVSNGVHRVTVNVDTNAIRSIATNVVVNNSSTGSVQSVGLTMDGIIFSNTVPGSPVTNSGTLVPGLLKESANKVLAGPISGAAATPTFRSLAAEDLPIVAGSNVTLSTNANVLTIASTGGGPGGTVITNFATTNTDTGLTNAIFSIATNQIPNFIHGTTNYIAKFTPNTNEVGNSIVFEAATNQWEWRSRPTGTAWTNSVTNRIFGQYTSEANYSALDIISSYGTTTPPATSSEFNLIQGKQGSGSTSLIFPLRLMDAWQINSAVNTPGGFTAGYLTPLVDNTYNIGSTSSQVHDIDLGGQILWNTQPTAPAVAKIGGYGLDPNTTGLDIWEVSFGVFSSFANLNQGGRQLDMGQNVLSFSGTNPKTANTPRGFITFGNNDQSIQIGTNNATVTGTQVRLNSSRGTGTDHPGADFQIAGGAGTGQAVGGNIYFATSGTNSASSSTLNGYTNRMEIDQQTGNVIIYSNLTVNGSVTAGGSQVNGSNIFGLALSTTNTAHNVGIGTEAPTHVLHIVTATNDAVGIDSTGTDSSSMLHIKNVGVQGPFFDFWSSADRWGFGIASGGNFNVREGAVGADPVNGTTVFSLTPDGIATVTGNGVSTVIASNTVTTTTFNVINQNASTLNVTNPDNTVFIMSSLGVGTNTTLYGATNYGSIGKTNWTWMDANGWHNTNNAVANQEVDISKGTINAQGGITNAGVLAQSGETDLTGATNYVSGNTRHDGGLNFGTNLTAAANFNKSWSITNVGAAYTQAGPIGVDTALLTFQQTLYTVTNNSGAAVLVTLPGGLKKATWWGTNVTGFYVTNATMQWWTCRPGETNVYIEGGY